MESNAFGDHCTVHMESEDPEVLSAFEDWQLNRSERFVNPRSEYPTFIKGALILCEGGLIGRGGQGSVKLKQNMASGDVLAVKTVNFGTRLTAERWEELKDRETQLQELRCPCLVCLEGFYFDDQRRSMTIGMEYVSCGISDSSGSSLGQNDSNRKGTSVNLKEVLEREPPWWTNKAKAISILGIAHGIDHLHSKGFIHRDLKPSNILFDEEMRPKICDFDVARAEAEDSSATMTMSVGTSLYMAPEVSSGYYNHKAERERDPAAVHKTGKYIIAVFIGAENMLAAGKGVKIECIVAYSIFVNGLRVAVCVCIAYFCIGFDNLAG